MKTKKTVLTLAFFILISIIRAQGVHEYVGMQYTPSEGKLAISKDGKEFSKESVDYEKHEKSGYNANPLLEKVIEYETKGWEVVTLNLNHRASGGLEVYYCFMRKKKADQK
jgi:hypothetical protein